MRKFLLALGLLVTTANLAIGISYAAVCQGTGGARSCGTNCVTVSGGQCGCSGACTADELNWVDGAHKVAAGEELLAE